MSHVHCEGDNLCSRHMSPHGEIVVWRWTITQDGERGFKCAPRHGSDPLAISRHGDAVRTIVGRVLGGGWLPVLLGAFAGDHAEYDLTHVDGREAFIYLHRD